MSLLEELKSSQQLVSQPCPPLPGIHASTQDRHTNTHEQTHTNKTKLVVCVSGSGARSTWKSLKVQFMSSVEETETLLQQLQNKVQQTEDRRHRLRQLLCRLDDKVCPTAQSHELGTMSSSHVHIFLSSCPFFVHLIHSSLLFLLSSPPLSPPLASNILPYPFLTPSSPLSSSLTEGTV